MASPASIIGRTLGHYRIVGPIGAGGMGVVYRAHDDRLDRDVAVKVLPPSALADEAARKRFRKEALTLSKLNHPNIATVHDFDRQDGIDFLVMEYVSGLTLAEELAKGPLAVNEVLALGEQIAKTLEDAHEAGVVHRDLKPGNIMVTSKRQVKLLDFGLAKLLRITDQDVTQSLSEQHGAVGTLPYMAPEQLRGEQPDFRSDIYALGAVLYEMATGRRPFAETLAPRLTDAILHREPDPPSNLNPRLSPELERIILKCLDKERERRYQSARELAVDLHRSAHPSLALKTPRPRSKGRQLAFLLLATVVALVVVPFLSRFVHLRKSATVSLPEYEQLTNFSDAAYEPVLSPDGRMLAFTRGFDAQEIYIKPLPNGEPVLIAKDAFEKSRLAFSPDGSRIAYTVEAPLAWDTWVVPILGGQPRRMLPNASGLTWIDDHHVLFSEVKKGIHMGVVTATESRTEARDVYLPPTETGMAHESYLSPDRRWVLLTEMDATGDLPCRVVPFDGSSTGYQVGPKAPCASGAWSPDAKWLYVSADAGGGFHIWRQQFPRGEPEQITFSPTKETQFAVAPDGRSLVTDVRAEQSSIWLHEATGGHQISSEGFATLASFSSDDRKLYYLVRAGPPRAFLLGELWVADLASGRSERIFPGVPMTHYDISRDGRTVVFSSVGTSGKSGIWLASLDRRFPPRQLTSSNEYWPFFGREDEMLFVGEEGNRKFLYHMKLDGTQRQKVIPDEVLYLASVSPDGEWAVAWTPVTGKEESSAVVAYPTGGGTPILICDVCTSVWTGTSQGAPVVGWSPDGTNFYVSFQYFPGMNRAKTFVVPLRRGQTIPALPKRGIVNENDVTSLPGVRVISEKDVFASSNPSIYAFRRLSYNSNIYRVRLPP